MKFYVYVEGDLEQRVLPKLLEKWLYSRLQVSVEFADPVNFNDCGKFLKEIGRSAHGHLTSPEADNTIAAIGLLDLKGPEDHNFYPNACKTVEERHDFGVEEIERRVDHPKFKMFFAVHEFEAWLLSQPAIFPQEVQAPLFEGMPDPEEVNFGEPPAARITRVYREAVQAERLKRRYRKISMGTSLFNSLDVDLAYEKCSYLRRMLDAVLKLAQDACY